MSKLDDIERQLIEATHASQYRAPMAGLIGVLKDLQCQVDTLTARLDTAEDTEEVPDTEDAGTPVLVPRKRAARRATAE